MRAKLTVGLLLVILAFYCWLVITKGVIAISEGGFVPVLFGIALLITAVFVAGLALREVQFGRRTAELARTLEAEGSLLVDDLPRRPSGRVDRAAADAVFAERRAETEAAPEDWRTWYRLAHAYDAAGDRTRGRRAARHAIELFDQQR